jgi:L-lysine exporter family protein LysE/ArgO
VFLTGLFLGFGLILAIGPQNIFIIKQGMKKEYSYQCAFICSLCDSSMVFASLFGLHQVLLRHQKLQTFLMIGAIIFLTVYAGFCFKNAYKNRLNRAGVIKHFDGSEGKIGQQKFLKLVFLALGFSILNPQAILDCMVIIGGYAQSYPSDSQYIFGLGVMLASFLWFLGLTTVSILAGEHLKKPIVWYYLEMVSGILMLLIALRCFFQLLNLLS